ncbi:MAG: response regulator transcription factor [Magnetococcus sp. WYHC-3]
MTHPPQDQGKTRGEILVVEDDELVRCLLVAYLQKEGYHVTQADSGGMMRHLVMQRTFDLILLDLGLPDEDGLAIVEGMRREGSIPIIVLTSRQSRENRITALELGSDDFLTKPFDPEELILRIRNVLERSRRRLVNLPDGSTSLLGPNEIYRLRFRGWILDPFSYALRSEDGTREWNLSRSEFHLLSSLVYNSRKIMSRAQLLELVSGVDSVASERLIDVLISRLRRKVERDPRHPEIIVTISGMGYKFTPEVAHDIGGVVSPARWGPA